MNQKDSTFALVLPGAVARGAYEAGVIAELAEADLKINRIVATSSGALNGLAYAAGIRAGNAQETAELLSKWWITNGGWRSTMSLSPLAMLSGRGLASQEGLFKLMRDAIKPCTHSAKQEIEFHVIIAPLDGTVGKIGKKSATTYECEMKFSGADFDTQEGLERIFKVVAAACSFPGLFEPVEIDGLGACVDGGTVNNAPIRSALSDSGVDRVILAVPFPEIMNPGGWKKGLALFNHLVEVLINERLFRDLRDAQVVNDQLTKLGKLVAKGALTAEQGALVEKAFSIRKIDVIEIRPEKPLRGGAFSGFFSRRDREQLVADGREAARNALAARAP